MPGVVIHPATGEVLDLEAPTETLARWLSEARELDREMRVEKIKVVNELLSRMDTDAAYTVRTERFDITGDGPEPPKEYDARGLRVALAEFVEAGVITQDALDRAVEVVPTYKPRAAGLNALRRLPGSIGEVIDRHSRPKEDHRRNVSVKPRKP